MPVSNSPVTPTESAVYRDIPGGYALVVSLAQNIRRLRRAANLTQTQLGEQLGVGQGAVSKWEKGTTKPDASDLPALARRLGKSLDTVLEGLDAQYDSGRDLIGQGRTVESALHTGGADGTTAARIRELEGRIQAYQTVLKHVGGWASHILDAVGAEGAPLASAQRRRSVGHRNTG